MWWTEEIIKEYNTKEYKIVDNLTDYFNKNFRKKIQQEEIDINLLPDFLVRKLNLDKTFYWDYNKEYEYDLDDVFPDITEQYNYKVVEKEWKRYWEMIYGVEYFNGNSVQYYINLVPEDMIIIKNKNWYYQWHPYILHYQIITFINDTTWGSKDIFWDIWQWKWNKVIKDKSIVDYLNNFKVSLEEKKIIVGKIINCYIEDNWNNIYKKTWKRQVKKILVDLEQSNFIDWIICSYCSALVYPESLSFKDNNTLVTEFTCPNCWKKVEKKISFD